VLRPSDKAPGLLVGEAVEIADDAVIGGHVVIHGGTRVGAGVQLQDGAVLGKPVALGPHSRAKREQPEPLVVEDGAVICAGAVVFAGARVALGAVVGDQAHVRERAVVGTGSVVGRGSAIDNDVVIGARVRIQTGCYITAFSWIEDDVFVAPGVFTTNDNTMGRRFDDPPLRGATLRRACRVGAGVVLLPGVEIGEEAFISAGSLVTRNVPPRAVMMGAPAKKLREVEASDFIEKWTR
jgi:acetyltransferase-like isoleucine patch superfamily enzyme